MRLQLAVQDGVGRSPALIAERLVNLYAEKSPDGAKSPVNLVGSPGSTLFSAIATALPVRGMRVMSGVLYAVVGARLYSVDSSGTSTLLGTLDTTTNPVIMSDNGTQLCIVTNPNAFIYSVGGGLVQITDVDFPGATSVDFLDGYFIFSTPNSGQFFISALYDGTAYDALDFATAESNPDNLVRCFVDHRELWLFGTQSTEIWYDSGDANFPFSRVEGAIAERGLGAVYSVAKLDNSIFWLDNTGIVRRADHGYVPVRVSTHAIEYQVSRGTLSSCTAFTYAAEGHEFYVLTVPNVGTFVYDAATALWHERKSYGVNQWNAGTYAYAYNKHLIGDTVTGNIYQLSLDTFSENGNPLIAEMVFPPIQMDGDWFRIHQMQLDMERGTGGATDSMVTMETSKDGVTWSNENWKSFGALGERIPRVLWYRIGRYNTCHIRFRISDPVKRAIYSAYARMTRDSLR